VDRHFTWLLIIGLFRLSFGVGWLIVLGVIFVPRGRLAS
jgi:hypothetical protein